MKGLCVLHVWNIAQRHITGILCPTNMENERNIKFSFVLHVWNTELRHINGFCVLQECNIIMWYINFMFPTRMDHGTQTYKGFCVLHTCNMKLVSEVSKQNFEINDKTYFDIGKMNCQIYCVSSSFLWTRRYADCRAVHS